MDLCRPPKKSFPQNVFRKPVMRRQGWIVSGSIGQMNAVFPPWPIPEFRDRSDGIPESGREDSIFRGAGAFFGRTIPRSWSRIAQSRNQVLDPSVPTSNKPLPSSCQRRFHNKSCDARAWYPPFSQEADVLQFTILLPVHAHIRNAVGENNSGFRQHRLVRLLCGAQGIQVKQRLCFS